MSTKVPVKSILKTQPPPPPSATTTPQQPPDNHQTQAATDRKNLTIALKHAYLIQHQKDIQARILSSIETLLDFPPTTTDPPPTTTFLHHLTPFQPGDYDDLIQERHIDSRCGWPLCPHPPRPTPNTASWKRSPAAAAPDATAYCSHACRQKSHHIRAQLPDLPAWERDPTLPVEIQLPPSPSDDDSARTRAAVPSSLSSSSSGAGDGETKALPYRPAPSTATADATDATGPPTHPLPAHHHNHQQPQRNPQQQHQDDEELLALERGETRASHRPAQVLAERIVEKRNPVFRGWGEETEGQGQGQGRGWSATAIEGWEPKRRRKGAGAGAGGDKGDREGSEESEGSEDG